MMMTGISAGLTTFGNKTPEFKKAKTPARAIQHNVTRLNQPDQFSKSSPAFGLSSVIKPAVPAAKHPPKFSGLLTMLDLVDDPADIIGAPPKPIKGEPPMEVIQKTNPEKAAVVKELSHWLTQTLEAKNVKAALIARLGNQEVHRHDKTGMAHSGIVVFNEQDKQWQIYNLINDVRDEEPVAHLFRSTPEDFFYGQSSMKKDALLLIPEKEDQEKLKESFKNGDYKKMYFTQDYNLITAPDTMRSLNCNKWGLMTLLAAKTGIHEPEPILDKISAEFTPGLIQVNPMIRPFAKQRPTILKEEVPIWDDIYTVTIESLHNSNLFPEKIFHSGKTMEERHKEATQSNLFTMANAGYLAAGAGAGALLLMGVMANNRRRRRLPNIF